MNSNQKIVALKNDLADAMDALVDRLVQDLKSPQTMPNPYQNDMSSYYKPEQIAKSISVSVESVRRWCRNGELKYTKFGRAMRISTEDWKRYCRDNTIK
jgi:excisionase family DNA binding protein